jgi:hypothetical protein
MGAVPGWPHRCQICCGIYCLLVAGDPVQELLLRANYLFVAAMVCLGWEVI